MKYDIHTHILPGMDDGAADAEAALGMLRAERGQGVEEVAFTPHYYRDREDPKHFLARRQAALERLCRAAEKLPAAEREQLPRGVLAAEVAWMPNLSRWEELEALCIGKTRYFLLELPFYPWDGQLIDQLYGLLACTRFIPVLAHLERYYAAQKRAYLQEICSMGMPVQFSAAPLQHKSGRKQVLSALQTLDACVVASDCHDLVKRPPDLGPAWRVLEKKLDAKALKRIEDRAGMLLEGSVALA